MKLKLPEWLYLDPTKPTHQDNRDSWGYPIRKADNSADRSEPNEADEQNAPESEGRTTFTIRHAGIVAVDLVRRGWNYQGNGVVTAGINNLQYRQPEVAPVSEDNK